MGCGAGKGKGEEEKPTNNKELEKKLSDTEKKLSATEKKLADAEVEIAALKKELEKHKKKIDAVKSAGGVQGVSVMMVLDGEQVAAVAKNEGVSLHFVQGEGTPIHNERENVVIVTAKDPQGLGEVLPSCLCPPTIERIPKPVVDAPPPPIEKEVEKPPEEEEEKPKIAVPDATVEASTDIDLGEWNGVVPLKFTWINEPSPFSEFNDPSGSNWHCNTNVRKAPGKPSKVSLEYRQGMTGEWSEIPAENFEAKMTLQPEKVEGSAYRGYQSRWIVDGDKYLSALQLAPTLQSKLMSYPVVRNAIKALPADKQNIQNIENENLRKALMTVENIIPMNTWDIDYGVTKMPGAYINGEHILTLTEKVEMIAKLKSADPSIQAEVRKTILKSPIMGANAAAGTVGVKLDVIVANMDFFLPKMTDPDFAQMQSIEDKTDQWEILRREMQVDVNELYPTFQSGLRVTFPPTRVIQNAMKTKRPVVEEVTLPVIPKFVMKSDKVYIEKKNIKFVYWKDGEDYSTAKKLDLDAPEEVEKFGLSREEKPVWKNYAAVMELPPAVYRYHWEYEGEPYFNNGSPYGPEFKPGACYQTFSLMCAVQFGIGVAM